jgi:4-amino-4-deoxy-L-arabinose transferase-like glycosyltransferase
MGAAIGLGTDETYVVAAGRVLRLGYFDHPPAVWWLSWLGAHLAGTDAPLAVRLPFILLFAGTTWLMFALTARLFDARAGLWAAVALNLSPVLGLTTAGWVLPDGPLVFFLLAATLFLVRALERDDFYRDWLGFGLCAGLAVFSKYNAVLVLGGAGLHLLSSPRDRRWLARPQPYVAAAVACAVFAPVVVWNAAHGWASFAFQGARAGARALHPFGPLIVLGGEALFLLPWIWAGLMACFVAGLRAGPGADRKTWLLCCMAAPPIVLFALVAAWSSGRVLFHWAAPGYLMLFPLLGREIAVRLHRRDVRAWIWGTAALTAVALLLIAVEFNAAPAQAALARLHLRQDPNLEAVDWRELRDVLAARGVLTTPGLVAGAANWRDAGRLDYALGGAVPVLCLSDDRRQYGLNAPPAAFSGRPVLVVTRANGQVPDAYVADWRPLAPVTIHHDGRPVLDLALALGRVR